MPFTFKIWEKIKEAWPIYKVNLSAFLLLFVATLVVKMVGTKKNWVLLAISCAVSFLFSYVWIRFTLALVDKKVYNPFSKEALPTFKQYWNLVKTIVLNVICVFAGFILLIIPGFYISGRLFFAIYLSVDKNQGGRASIKESWKMTEGYGWKIFWYSFVVCIFIAIGFIALFVGSFITYPIGMIVIAMMFRGFSKMRSEIPSSASPIEVVKELPKEFVKEELTKEEIKEEKQEETKQESI